MTQSRYSTLIGLCLLLLLAGGFYYASRLVIDKVHNSVAAAVATATVVVLPPTPTRPPATATPKGGTHRHPVAQATDTPSATSATVTVGASLQAGSATTTFPAGTGTYYCMVTLPNLPLSTPITFKWESMPSGSVIFPYTEAYSSPQKYTYLSGPEPPGHYRCQVFAPVNGALQLLGSAPFTVTAH